MLNSAPHLSCHPSMGTAELQDHGSGARWAAAKPGSGSTESCRRRNRDPLLRGAPLAEEQELLRLSLGGSPSTKGHKDKRQERAAHLASWIHPRLAVMY